LILSGTVFAMSSTFPAVAAVVEVVGPLDSVLLVHPDSARAPVAANTAAMRQIFVRRPSHPADTVSLYFLLRGPGAQHR